MQIRVIDNVFCRVSIRPNTTGDIWFFHGFGSFSGSFETAFTSILVNQFNLYAIDFPGFGVSPLIGGQTALPDSCQVALNLIRKTSPNRKVFIVAHALSGIIGARICRELSDQIGGYVSIEGSLTAADIFFAGFVVNFASPEAFQQGLLQMIYDGMEDNPGFQGYYASLRLAHPQALAGWGSSAVALGNEQNAGREFSELNCKKLYYWGRRSTAVVTQEFLKANHVPNKEYQNAGHTPMIEQPEQCYQDMLAFFTT